MGMGLIEEERILRKPHSSNICDLFSFPITQTSKEFLNHGKYTVRTLKLSSIAFSQYLHNSAATFH